MADIKIQRLSYSRSETIGIIYLKGLRFFTLELPWLDNQKNISCIPTGEYNYIKRVSPGKGYEVIELVSVPDRAYIQIHLGNYTRQIEGCILPGTGLKDINRDGVIDVTNSKEAFNQIMTHAPVVGTLRIV